MSYCMSYSSSSHNDDDDDGGGEGTAGAGSSIDMKDRGTVTSYLTINIDPFMSIVHIMSVYERCTHLHSVMTTRGYLIFKYNGIYYVIYNHWDAYVTRMGAANMEVLKKLCKDFNGNVALARQHLRTLFEALVARSKEAGSDEEGNPSSNFVSIWNYTSDGFSLAEMSDSRSVIHLGKPSTKPPQANFFSDHMWEVDLDAGRFGMGTTQSGTVLAYWSWRALYLMSAAAWLEDAEDHLHFWKDGYVVSKTSYDRTYKAILIQATIRRFLALRRALRPPDGYLFRKAKREFEALQHGR